MDVADWLRSLGLGQYEATFRENGIDVEVLPDLTDADLEKLGVLLGHRKRLLKAIAGLNLSATRSSASAAVISSPQADAAERRQLTVMFCDLVGSTAMSARLDPEDMRGDHRRPITSAARALIAGNGGFVAKYMGDGVLAYFGYPQAHEHDAERAVRAGLAIVEAAPKLETAAGAPLHVRVGIATGIVVVGDLLGSGEAQERGVVGDTPNLAARLQSDRRARQRRHRRGHAQAAGRPVRLARPRPAGPQGRRRADARFRGVEGEFAGEPVRGAARGRADRTRRARGRDRTTAAALGQGEGGRGPGGAALGRGGHRQVAPDGGVPGAAGGRAAYAYALLLFAAAHRQRALSDHRPHGARGRARARGRREDQARQARRAAREVRHVSRGCRAFRRDAVPAERRPLSRAGTRPAAAPAENDGGADRPDRGDLRAKRRS